MSRVVTLLSLLFLLSGCMSPYPTDETLIKRFEKNEGMFNDILNQLQARPDIGYLQRDVAFYSGRGRVTEPGEEKELRTLMGQLGLVDINPDGDLTMVHMGLTRNSSIFTGRGDIFKGYAYLSEPPLPIRTVEDLGAIGDFSAPADVNFYRHVKGNWYLYLKIQD